MVARNNNIQITDVQVTITLHNERARAPCLDSQNVQALHRMHSPLGHGESPFLRDPLFYLYAIHSSLVPVEDPLFSTGRFPAQTTSQRLHRALCLGNTIFYISLAGFCAKTLTFIPVMLNNIMLLTMHLNI